MGYRSDMENWEKFYGSVIPRMITKRSFWTVIVWIDISFDYDLRLSGDDPLNCPGLTGSVRLLALDRIAGLFPVRHTAVADAGNLVQTLEVQVRG